MVALSMNEKIQTSPPPRFPFQIQHLKVSSKDLYNALGSLRAVQMARDAYNSTCGAAAAGMSDSEMMWKRKPMLEHLSSLGQRAPTERHDTTDIVGLDDLVALVEMQNADSIGAVSKDAKGGMYTFDSLQHHCGLT